MPTIPVRGQEIHKRTIREDHHGYTYLASGLLTTSDSDFQLQQTPTTLDQTTLRSSVESVAKTYPPLNRNSVLATEPFVGENPPVSARNCSWTTKEQANTIS